MEQQQGSDASLLRLRRSMSEMAISRRGDSDQQQQQQKKQKQAVMLRRQASVGFSSCSGRRRGLFSATTTSCLPLRQSPPRQSLTSLLGNESEPAQQSQDNQDDDNPSSAAAAVPSCIPSRALSRAQSGSFLSLVLGSSRSRQAWQEIGSRESQGNPTGSRDLATSTSTSNPLWRTLVRRLVKQRRQMVSGILGRRQSSKMVDFSYDESSYAKNFDMGHEAWQRDDPSFRLAAIKQAQCTTTTIGRSHSVHCLCTGPESLPKCSRNTRISPQRSAPPLWQRRSLAQPAGLSPLELSLNRSNSSRGPAAMA